MPDIAALLRLASRDRVQLVLENIALRQQLAVYKRSVGRPNITDRDRTFWLTVMRMLRDWRDAVVIVRPATVIKWHRNGFRYYWRRKSRSKPGRPPIAMAVIMLIRRMSIDNVTWGAPRIKDELALLGHEVAVSTVAKYMVRTRKSEPDQSWRTFLHNHMAETAACDFFVVPTATFQRLFCFVVMSLDRRRILHVNVTSNPTAEWVAQQIVEAFPGDGWVPRCLQRDRDGAYGWAFRRKVKAMGITEPAAAPSTRRRCTRVTSAGRRRRRRCDARARRPASPLLTGCVDLTSRRSVGKVYPQLNDALSVALESRRGARVERADDVFGKDIRRRLRGSPDA